jgi:hypothetical protein
MSYIYTYELGLLVNISANSLEEANKIFHQTAEELLSTCDSPGYESALCHVLDESSETLFKSEQEFIPYPLLKKQKSELF